MHVVQNVRQQSQENMIKVRKCGRWCLATVVGRRGDILEYRLEEPVTMRVDEPLLARMLSVFSDFFSRRPYVKEITVFPRGHRDKVNVRHGGDRVRFQ